MDEIHPLKKIVFEIRHSNIPNKAVYFSQKYPQFKVDYPRLFTCALDKHFPLQYLDFMFDMKKELETQNISLSNADKIVYEKLQEQYVTPFITPQAQQHGSSNV